MWKAYFAFLLLIVLVTLAGRLYLLFARNTGSAYGIAEAFVSLVAVAGVYGYVFHEPLGRRSIWRLLFVVVAIGWLFHFVAPDSQMAIRRAGKLRGGVAILAGQLILLPGILALYRYAFRLPELWDN